MLAGALRASGEDRDFIASKMIEMMNDPLGDQTYRKALSDLKNLGYLIYLCLAKLNPDLQEKELMGVMEVDDINRIASVLLSLNAKNSKGAAPKKPGRPRKNA